jgi:hypothetical protein
MTIRNRPGVLSGVVLAISMVLAPGGSASLTPQTFVAKADAWVDEANPTVNHGTTSPLPLDAAPKIKAAYLRFNVAGVVFPVAKVTLKVFAKTSSAAGYEVRPVTDTAWGETTIAYATAPPRGNPVASSGPVTSGQFSSVDVTGLVSANGLVSLALTTTSAVVSKYASREVAAKAPRLEIDGVVITSTTTTSSSTTSSSTTSSSTTSSSTTSSSTTSSSTTSSSTSSSSTTTTTGPVGGDPVLLAAGDIACDPLDGNFNGGDGMPTACRMRATSDLLLPMAPTAIATLGDNQYDSGNLDQFNASFDASWGQVKDRIQPAIGNHEYKVDPTAAGYFTYFGAAAGDPTQGWYSYTLGSWHIVVLNSNCNKVGGCGAGSPQEQWLQADLAAHPDACTLAYWHHPRWSSGTQHGSEIDVDAFWRDLQSAGVEVVLNGHEHSYERFAPQTPDGVADAGGIREFVVGTGGRSHYALGTALPNSEVRNGDTFGVLALTLHPDGYDWEFVPEAGQSFTDSGSDLCH